MKHINAQDEIIRLWKLIQEIFVENYNVKNDRIILRLDKKHIPQLYLETKQSRKKTDNFTINIKGQNPLSSRKMGAEKVFLAFIQFCDVKKVQDLKLKTTGQEDIISNQDDSNGRRRKFLDGKYVFVKTSTSEKVNTIRKIIQQLSIEGEIIDE